MGRVMGALKARYAGRMDFGTANALVKSRLS
ncbi:MAG: GatB/YqeY domain-containing protein [Kiloniellales bacterium]